jgi:hypothetical protein
MESAFVLQLVTEKLKNFEKDAQEQHSAQTNVSSSGTSRDSYKYASVLLSRLSPLMLLRRTPKAVWVRMLAAKETILTMRAVEGISSQESKQQYFAGTLRVLVHAGQITHTLEMGITDRQRDASTTSAFNRVASVFSDSLSVLERTLVATQAQPEVRI